MEIEEKVAIHVNAIESEEPNDILDRLKNLAALIQDYIKKGFTVHSEEGDFVMYLNKKSK